MNEVAWEDKPVAGEGSLIPFIYVGWMEEICLFAVGGAIYYSDPESTISESAYLSYCFGYSGIVGITTFFWGAGGILSVKDVLTGLVGWFVSNGDFDWVGAWGWGWGFVCPNLKLESELALYVCDP